MRSSVLSFCLLMIVFVLGGCHSMHLSPMPRGFSPYSETYKSAPGKDICHEARVSDLEIEKNAVCSKGCQCAQGCGCNKGCDKACNKGCHKNQQMTSSAQPSSGQCHKKQQQHVTQAPVALKKPAPIMAEPLPITDIKDDTDLEARYKPLLKTKAK